MRLFPSLSGFCFVVCSLVLPPAVFAAEPAWVSGDSVEYPNELYLVGRGIGSTSEEAQNRARGDLATVFEVRVQVANENSTTVAQTGGKERISKLATQQVSAKTDKVISGINIAQIWRNPASMDFYALAVLSRSQAGASLREEISKIDSEVAEHIESAKASTDPLLKVAGLSQALATSIKRDGFQASLKVVDSSGRGIVAPILQSTIQAQLADTLKQIRVSPKVEEDAGFAQFPSILKGGLAAAGFLASSESNAELILVGKLTFSDLGLKANWYWARATVEVSLIEKESGRLRGSKTWPVKASALDAKTARSRTLIEIEKLLKSELRSSIIEFAAN